MAYTAIQGDPANWTLGFGNAGGAISHISGNQYLSERPAGVIPPDHPAHVDMDAASIIKITQNNPTTADREEYNSAVFTPTLDLSASSNMVIRYDLASLDGAAQARFYVQSSFANRNYVPFQAQLYNQLGVNHIAADFKDTASDYSVWQAEGAINTAAINRLQIVFDNGGQGSVQTLYLFDWLVDYKQDPIYVALCADDSEVTQYTNMYPELRSRGLPMSLACIPERIANADLAIGDGFTTANLNEMFANGLDVAGHSTASFETLTEAQVETYLTDTLIPFLTPYVNKGARQVHAYAQGDFGQTTDAVSITEILANNGFTLGRTTQQAFFTAEGRVVDRPLELKSITLGQNAQDLSTAAEALAEIDRAIGMGVSISFTTHHFVASLSGSPALEFLVSEWQTFLDGLVTRQNAGTIRVLSLAQLAIVLGQAQGQVPPRISTPLINRSDPVGVAIAGWSVADYITGASSYVVLNAPSGIDVSDPLNITGTPTAAEYRDVVVAATSPEGVTKRFSFTWITGEGSALLSSGGQRLPITRGFGK